MFSSGLLSSIGGSLVVFSWRLLLLLFFVYSGLDSGYSCSVSDYSCLISGYCCVDLRILCNPSSVENYRWMTLCSFYPCLISWYYIWNCSRKISLTAAFHLQKIFRGQERNGKISADRNGKFSVVNFHFFLALYFKSESKQRWPD